MEQLNLLDSKALISFDDKTDAKSRKYITAFSIQAYRNVCDACKEFEMKFDAEYIRLQKGVVIWCDTPEWKSFCSAYSDICEGEDFGDSYDHCGGKLLFSKEEGHEWFKFGAYRNISVWKYFEMEEEKAAQDPPTSLPQSTSSIPTMLALPSLNMPATTNQPTIAIPQSAINNQPPTSNTNQSAESTTNSSSKPTEIEYDTSGVSYEPEELGMYVLCDYLDTIQITSE